MADEWADIVEVPGGEAEDEVVSEEDKILGITNSHLKTLKKVVNHYVYVGVRRCQARLSARPLDVGTEFLRLCDVFRQMCGEERGGKFGKYKITPSLLLQILVIFCKYYGHFSSNYLPKFSTWAGDCCKDLCRLMGVTDAAAKMKIYRIKDTYVAKEEAKPIIPEKKPRKKRSDAGIPKKEKEREKRERDESGGRGCCPACASRKILGMLLPQRHGGQPPCDSYLRMGTCRRHGGHKKGRGQSQGRFSGRGSYTNFWMPRHAKQAKRSANRNG